MFESRKQSRSQAPRITAAILLTPVPMLLGMAGSPWAAATPLALLAFLASLAWMSQPVWKEAIA